MCGKSKIFIKEEKVKLFIGYIESYIEVGDVRYDGASYKEPQPDTEPMIEKLNTFTKEELIESIVQLVDNGEEA